MAEETPEVATERALVLDANILLRAVLGLRARNLIQRYGQHVSLLIPASCVDEVRKYLPELCRKRRLDTSIALTTLDKLVAVLNVVENAFLIDLEGESRRRIGRRDPDDWPVVALALAVKAPVWTEDKDFFGSGLATWTSDTVELYLANES